MYVNNQKTNFIYYPLSARKGRIKKRVKFNCSVLLRQYTHNIPWDTCIPINDCKTTPTAPKTFMPVQPISNTKESSHNPHTMQTYM